MHIDFNGYSYDVDFCKEEYKVDLPVSINAWRSLLGDPDSDETHPQR